MLFETKKDSAGYLPYTNNLSVFNNTSQPLFCQILGLEADPKYEIKIISIKDTVFNTGAFSLARPEFSFSTSLLPFSTLQKGYGKVKIRIQSKSIDSVFLVPVRLFFFPAKPSFVGEKYNKIVSLSIFPNPSSGEVKLNCTFQNPSPLHLHIFDELGTDIMTVFDGMMNEPQRDFSFTLPPGMYYARMETAEGVVTKKVVVE